MTTIAYKDGVMAADTSLTHNGVWEGSFVKIHILPDDRLVGIAGCPGMQKMFADWLQFGGDAPKFDRDDHFFALVAYPDGACSIYDRFMSEIEMNEPSHAIGSGKEMAIGAMAAGASAEQAVLIACKYDAYSAEPVSTMTVAAYAAEAAE